MTAAVILCGIDAALICFTVFLWKKNRLKTDVVMLIAANLIPIAGQAGLFILCLWQAVNQGGRKAGELEGFRLDSVRKSDFHQEDTDGDEMAVPLEDALILGDSGGRRAAMLDLLMDSSDSQMSSIRYAKQSEDSEVVHYATTAMTEASRKYDLRLQRAEARFRKNPDADAALDSYLDVLRHYLEDQMAEGELLEIQRHQYQKLLRVRIDRNHDQDDYADLASSLMDSGDYEEADRMIAILESRWRHWDRTLDLRLRYYYENGEGEQLQALLRRIQTEEVYIPEEVRETIRFWTKDSTAAASDSDRQVSNGRKNMETTA